MKSPFNFFSNSSDEERTQELKGLSLFKELSGRELRELEELLHERSYLPEEVIFDEGDIGLGLFIVVSGRVKGVSSHAGLKQMATEFGRGEVLGVLSVLDEVRRTARVVAGGPSKAVA